MTRPRRVLLLSCFVLTGCYTARDVSVLPLPVRLTSPSAFRLVEPAGPNGPAASCLALRAELDVSAVRGDTLHFARVAVLRQAAGAVPCTLSGAGFVVVTENPDLRAERLAFDSGLSAAATVALAVAIPLAGGLALLLLWSGT